MTQAGIIVPCHERRRSDLGYSTDVAQLGRSGIASSSGISFTYLREWLAPDFEVPPITRGEGADPLRCGGPEIDPLAMPRSGAMASTVTVTRASLRLLKIRSDRFAHSSFLGFCASAGHYPARRLIEEHLGNSGFTRGFLLRVAPMPSRPACGLGLQWQILTGIRENGVSWRSAVPIMAIPGRESRHRFGHLQGLPRRKRLQRDLAGRRFGTRRNPGSPRRSQDSSSNPAHCGCRAAMVLPWADGTSAQCRSKWCDRPGARLVPPP